MNIRAVYSRRLERKRRLLAARLRARDLTPARDNTAAIRPGDILLFATIRNEAPRIDWFLEYYRRLGVGHFLIVDNGSTDGSAARLSARDISLWRTEASYARANYGMHWLNALMRRHSRGHWRLVVDADEFLVYPHYDNRDLSLLTERLDAEGRVSMGALLLDLYPKGPIAACAPGADPIAAAPYFDPTGYYIRRDPRYRNLWIQGGPRLRAFFADRPGLAPALNKIPLTRHSAGVCHVSSTHALLPRAYNLTYDPRGGERLTGALLHAKFLADAPAKVAEELTRGEHYADSREYRAYGDLGARDLWTPHSARYEDWRQLEALGLVSAGGWL